MISRATHIAVSVPADVRFGETIDCMSALYVCICVSGFCVYDYNYHVSAVEHKRVVVRTVNKNHAIKTEQSLFHFISYFFTLEVCHLRKTNSKWI